MFFGKAQSVGVSRVDANTVSGNANHDVNSGKFGSGSGGNEKKNRIAQAPNQDPIRFMKFYDAIRDAARQKVNFNEKDLQEFLRGRASREPTADELGALLAQIRAARLTDLADVLDQALKKETEGMIRARKLVRVQAPKGWTQSVLSQLADDELTSLTDRLQARGWDAESLKTHVVSSM